MNFILTYFKTNWLAVISFLSICVGAFWIWATLTSAEAAKVTLSARLQTAEQVSALQGASLENLKKLRDKDALALSKLTQDYQTLSARSVEIKSDIRALEKLNAEVKSYLDQPVPTELGKLLRERSKSRTTN